jgi:DNA-binding transcriptional LysR family regulator
MPSNRNSAVKSPVQKGAGEGTPDLFLWDDLQFFLELARKGTLARAARRLGVSHTTVLRRIANLERKLDRKLFDRTSGGFVLNEGGWQLLEHAEEMERAADSIFHLGSGTSELSGAVRIAVIEGLATRVLTPAFKELREEHPEIVIEIVTAMQIVNLTKREADISVGLTRPTGPRLIARRLAKCDVHLYASHRYLEEHGEPETLEALSGHRFVDYIEDMIEIQALRWFRDTVGPRNVVFRSTSPLTQLEAVRRGVGIGMFPDYLIRPDEDEVKLIAADEVSAERELWLAIHADLRNVPRMAAVFNFLKQVFQSDQVFDNRSAS